MYAVCMKIIIESLVQINPVDQNDHVYRVPLCVCVLSFTDFVLCGRTPYLLVIILGYAWFSTVLLFGFGVTPRHIR